MTKRNSTIIALLSIVLVAVIVLLALSVLRQQQLSESSQAMAIKYTQQILSLDADTQVPNVEALLDNAHSSLLAQRSRISSEQYLLRILRNMGQLQVVENISGNSQTPLFLFSSQAPSADYALDAVFTNGRSRVVVRMLFEDDVWLIEEFTVQSELMTI